MIACVGWHTLFLHRKAKQMVKRADRSLVGVAFDYAPLAPGLAKQVRDSAERIRQTVKQTVQDIIQVGKELLGVKELLPHGKFGSWLKAEFGWSERTAQNFMSVAERLGPKSEVIADLTLQPTAAYLLAASTVPDEAREKAISRGGGWRKNYGRRGQGNRHRCAERQRDAHCSSKHHREADG